MVKLSSFTAPSASGAVSFEPPLSYPLKYQPTAIAVGDFSGNGILDLAVSTFEYMQSPFIPYGSGWVSLFKGHGDGTFSSGEMLQTGGFYSIDVIAADLQGSGRLDLAVSNRDSSAIGVFYSNEDGTFPTYPSTLIAFSSSSYTQLIAAGKFDPNLKGLSFVVPLSAANEVAFYPSPASSPSLKYAVGKAPYAVAVGDFRGMGLLDVAVVNQGGNTVRILLNNGDGTFTYGETYEVGTAPCSIAVGVFSGSGFLDLAVANQDSQNIAVLLGQGNGTFGPAAMYACGSSPCCVRVGDMTGNGKLDLVVANSGDCTVGILMGAGDGTFGALEPSATYAIPSSLAGETQLQPKPVCLALGDFANRGVLDVAVVCWAYQAGDAYSKPPTPSVYVNELLIMLQKT